MMPPTDSTAPDSSRAFGPIQLISTSLLRQVLGFVLAVVGLQISSWPIYAEPALASAVIHTVIGAFVTLNGVYLGGVRVR